jgi:hypothetical protein
MSRIITPQVRIAQLAECLYPGRTIKVTGDRPPMRGGKKRPFTAYLYVDGKVIATAQERDWRTAYKTLQINISKGNIL